MTVEWGEDGHPEEGSIHAWLDDELDAPEAALLDEHVRTCTACAARVAEARGLVAGASRVVGQLDALPARLIHPATTPTLGDNARMWRLMRVTPARASIAAMLIVALGIALTRTRVARESTIAPSAATAPAGEAMTAMAAPKEESRPEKDGLLDSAIGRRLAQQQPPRAFEPAPGVAIPTDERALSDTRSEDTTAPLRVAAARASLKARTQGAPPAADRARVGFNSGAPATLDRLSTAAQAAEAAGARADVSAKVAGVVISAPTANQCYFVESSTPGAQWGSVPLPMVLAFDSVGTTARVLTTNGGDTEMRAVRMPASGDSLSLRMRRIGYDGTLALSSIGDARGGIMRSSQSTVALSEVVTTATAQRASARAELRSAPQPAAAPLADLKKDANAVRNNAGSAGAAVSITAHTVNCTRR
ncbi:MAG: zf-HC2 domain-containing protein [bacterium]